MSKSTKVITLKLNPSLLTEFAPKPASRRNSKIKSTPSSASTPAINDTAAPTSTLNNGNASDNVSESNSTPAPANPSPQAEAPKKRGSGVKPGAKRGATLMADGTPKPRGKPGPKKKPRLEDGTIDHSAKPTTNGVATTHKLGPKANQGAINAGLRALDRSGKPCRKWERKSLQLKSFTGVMWDLGSWKAPRGKTLSDMEDTKNISQTAESDSKANASSTQLESEKSNAGDGVEPMSTPAASSPAPIIATANG
ncbi:MAG: hypothetical protein Q9227_000298 [Pyrenula ochraceoflavens]